MSILNNQFRCGTGIVALGALLLTSFTAQAQGDVKSSTSNASGVTTEKVRNMIATVAAVDVKARTVVLKTQDGIETTYAVSEEVTRLGEVKPGDMLDISYLESVGLEFREPTAEELKDPLKITEETIRADKTHAPAGGQLKTVRAVVTLEGMSRLLNVLTVKGPRGNYFIVEVQPGTVKWESLRIGQQMMGTYSQGVVMAIDPVKK